MDENELEQKSKELLKWKISGKKERQNSFQSLKDLSECVNYLEKNKYVSVFKGEVPKSYFTFGGLVTERGRVWVGS